MCDRLKAAVDARANPAFVIMARTDAFAREGVDASLERAAAYVEAGADMVFAEALYTLDDYRAFTRAIGVPVLANLTEFGLTPLFTCDELGAAGVKLILYPLSAFRAMSGAALEVYTAIRERGTQKPVVAKMQTRESSTPCSTITPTSVSSTSFTRARRRLRTTRESRRDRSVKRAGRRRRAAKGSDDELGTSGARGRLARRLGRTDRNRHGRRRPRTPLSRLRRGRARGARDVRGGRVSAVGGELPTARQLDALRTALRARRKLPRALCEVLERIPATPIRWTCCARAARCSVRSSPSATSDELESPTAARAFPGMLLYWRHFAHGGKRIATDDRRRRRRPRIFSSCCTASRPPRCMSAPSTRP